MLSSSAVYAVAIDLERVTIANNDGDGITCIATFLARSTDPPPGAWRGSCPAGRGPLPELASRGNPGLADARRSAASAEQAVGAVERQVLHRAQPGLRRAHRRDGVQDAHGGRDEPAVVVIAALTTQLEVADHRRRALDPDAVAAGAGGLPP